MTPTKLQNHYNQCFPEKPKPFTNSEKASLVGIAAVSSAVPTGACLYANGCYKGIFQNLYKRNSFFAFPIGYALGKTCAIANIAMLHMGYHIFPGGLDLQERLKKETHYKKVKEISDWVVCLEAPVAEGLIFRGLLQPIFVRALGVSPGIAATAILFGGAHNIARKNPEEKIAFNLESASGLMQASSGAIRGIFLGVLRHQYGLLASIGAHVGNNCGVRIVSKLEVV